MKYNNGRYHRNVCWCLAFDNILNDISNKVTSLIFTDHIYEKHNTSIERKYEFNRITLKKIFKGEVIEVYIENREISKFLIRFHYDSNNDLLGVFSSRYNDLICITLWLNGRNDNHNNLDYSLYCKDLQIASNKREVGATIADLIGEDTLALLKR